ncbi:MAG: hypothetical protein MI742_01545 [Desulfobacterales bacterium]|nr:hypothetical protein [Desulfobacterales bacterium]
MSKENKHNNSEGDKFQQIVVTCSEYMKKNREKVALVGVFLIVSLALVVGLAYYAGQVDAKGAQAFGKIQASFADGVAKEGREATLTRFLARADATLTSLKGSSSYPGALMWLGGLALEKGEYDRAATWFGFAADEFDTVSSMKNIAWCCQGQALEEGGSLDKASEFYEKVRASGSEVKWVEATFFMARIEEMKGNLESAKVLFREVAESEGQSFYQEMAKEKLYPSL